MCSLVLLFALYADAQTSWFKATPLMDMPQTGGTCATYKGFPGGLYENCSNEMPADHDADGRRFAAKVQRLNGDGMATARGKVVLMSIGMSIALQEFTAFMAVANRSSLVNHRTLHIGNGAASGMDACTWFPAFGNPSCNSNVPNQYDRINSNLATGPRLKPDQVQVVWIKNANGRVHSFERGCSPLGTLCTPLCDERVPGCKNSPNTTDALNLEKEFGDTLRAAKQRWPNLKLAFITSRSYGGYARPSSANPEPFAYESGYAVKWLIEAQIKQVRTGKVDPVAGDLSYRVALWVAWGPYIWAAGPEPRSDGLAWCGGILSPNPPCNGEADFHPDGTHPSTVTKQVNMLMQFFLNSPYTHSWFAAK
jgi:hypothetical protein